MNIFEYLGLPADYRKESKVTQLVKHFDEVVDKHKNKNFLVQLKEDGVCAITVVKNGACEIFSRTGKLFTNTVYLRDYINGLDLRDGVYFGEMVNDKVSLEVLSGKVNPNRTQPLKPEEEVVATHLRMRFFDLISIESFIEGASQTKFTRRYANLQDRIETKPAPFNGLVISKRRYNPVSVIPVKEAWNVNDINVFLDEAVAHGEEGIVIIDPNADWEAGHKGWRKMKKVRGVDYDLTCIDYEEGKGKYKGLIANLIFKWKGGKTIKCMLGKGWTHQNAKDMFEAAETSKFYDKTIKGIQYSNPVGKIFQVYALEESSKGKLRLPKVGEQRFDKVEADA
jgi:ATP-dependent DNA ligase